MKRSEFNIPTSGIVKMWELGKNLEREGERVIHLNVGEPDFSTPVVISKAGMDAIKQKKTTYTSPRGLIELRQAIVNDHQTRGLNYTIDEVIVTPGAKHALYCTLLALVNPGDEVLLLTPTWVNHFTMVHAVRGKPVEIPTLPGFKVNQELLLKSVTRKTKTLILNTPNNPTGGGFTHEDLEIIAEVVKQRDLTVISDEIYSAITYPGFDHVSIASLPDMKERTIIIDGFSKKYAMTGWRLGYALAPKWVIDRAAAVQQNTTSCPAHFVQIAGIEALTNPDVDGEVQKMVTEYNNRRDMVIERISKIQGIECDPPVGAFYVFPHIDTEKDVEQLATQLLMEEKVSVVPGYIFGKTAHKHIRICYAQSVSEIKEGLNRLDNFLQKTLR